LRFDDLTPYLLLKNGNFLYKIPFRGDHAVVKVYYGSRNWLQTMTKSLQNFASGQSSYLPRTRWRIERECLAVWRERGFRVYETYDDVRIDAPGCRPEGYTVFEYRTGPSLNRYLNDDAIPLEDRLDVWRRFLLEWGRRHQLAIAEREPRLVHENGDGKHVLVLDEGFLWFDFEIVWTAPSRVADQVAHEIIQYLWQISKSVPESLRPRLLEETVAHYPDTDRLRDAWRFFLANRSPIQRIARGLDRGTARGRKPTSKYRVAARLRSLLEAS
jgi:hypothetical protein